MILPDLIEQCVNALDTKTYFLFGNWNELCADLAIKGSSITTQDNRYPLVLLHNDYAETLTGNRITVDNPKIYIICQSKDTYSTSERLVEVYKNLLYDIEEQFLKEMKKGSRFIKNLNELEYTRKDLYKLWVGDQKNRLPDFLDAVELSFRNLKYYKKTC